MKRVIKSRINGAWAMLFNYFCENPIGRGQMFYGFLYQISV